MRARRIVLTLALLTAAGIVATAAHPLGNFSVNRWAAIEAGTESLRLLRVVDAAEIPTLSWAAEVDTNGDGTESAAEIEAFARRRAEASLASMVLTVEGARVPLALTEARMRFSPGAGGLRTMRIEAVYEAPLPASPDSVAFTFDDTEYLERTGWRELIAYGVGDAAVADAGVPAADRSDALRSYPADALTVPPDVRHAAGRRLTGAVAEAARAAGRGATAAARTDFGGASYRARAGGF